MTAMNHSRIQGAGRLAETTHTTTRKQSKATSRKVAADCDPNVASQNSAPNAPTNRTRLENRSQRLRKVEYGLRVFEMALLCSGILAAEFVCRSQIKSTQLMVITIIAVHFITMGRCIILRRLCAPDGYHKTGPEGNPDHD